jgi:hypothetical protein
MAKMLKVNQKKIGIIGLIVAIVSCVGTFLALVPENQRSDWLRLFTIGKPIVVKPAGWQNTGIYIDKDNIVEITYSSGAWANCELSCPFTDGRGIENSLPYTDANIIDGCLHGALIARLVFDPVDTDMSRPSSMPAFCVGNHYYGSTGYSGYLQLASNDGFDFDNRGDITVIIKIR